MPPRRHDAASRLPFRARAELLASLKASIRHLMKEQHFTFEKLAERARVNERQLHRLADGETFGSLVTLHKVSVALHTTLDGLFSRRGDAPSSPSKAREARAPYRTPRQRRASESQLDALRLEATHLDSETVDMLLDIARGRLR